MFTVVRGLHSSESLRRAASFSEAMTLTLAAEKAYQAKLLAAVARCAYFLWRSDEKIAWPLSVERLQAERRNEALFESLAAFNERFAKLQDLLAAAMRHAALLLAEPASEFLKILAYFEKQGVIASAERWQLLRLARNQAAHEYEIDPDAIAEHFNFLHGLVPELVLTACRLQALCRDSLGVRPSEDDFAAELAQICLRITGSHQKTK